MKQLKIVKVDQEIYKRIKKYKKVIYVDEVKELEGIEAKDKVLVENALTLRKIKRKVFGVYEGKNYEELAVKLGKKTKYVYPEAIKDSKSKNNLIAVEFKSKKKIFSKILMILLLILLIGFVVFIGNDFIEDYRTNSFKDKISEVEKDISYVIIEINPSMILELVDGKVTNKGCLNTDCVTLFSDIDVFDKSLNNIIEELYNKALLNELDLEEGVKVYSLDEEVEDKVNLPYVNFQSITRDEEIDYIEEVIDNDTLKEEKTKKKSNDKRLEIYKDDKLYGDYFKCNYRDNDLECYITDELQDKLSGQAETFDELYTQLKYVKILERILDRFDIKYDLGAVEGSGIKVIDSIYLDDNKYSLFLGTCVASSSISVNPDEEVKTSEQCYDEFSFEVMSYDELIDADLVEFSKLELISKSYKEIDIVELRVVDGELNITERGVLWQN